MTKTPIKDDNTTETAKVLNHEDRHETKHSSGRMAYHDGEVKIEMINAMAMVHKNNKKKTQKEKKGNFVPYANAPMIYFEFVSDGSGPGIGEEDRGPFIRKTFLVLMIMLLFTGVVNFFIYNVPALKKTFTGPSGVMLGLLGCLLSTIGLYSIACYDYARVFPCNVIMTVMTVIGTTLICGCAIVKYKVVIIAYGFMATCVVILICFLISLTPVDFTAYYLYVFIALNVLLVCSIAVMLMQWLMGVNLTPVIICILVLQILCMSFSIIMQLQSILGGREVDVSPDEWMIAAVLLYCSVVVTFLKILRLLNLLNLDE